MLARRYRVRLIAFVVIAVVSVVYAGGRYAGLGTLFGATGYPVTVRLAESGGLFRGSEVTYRGVTVGKVGAVNLDRDGVSAELDIDDGAPPIPASARATVTDRSAVGEQYLDLQPPDGRGPFLRAGSVIAQNRTGVPLSPDTLLSHVDALVRGIDPGTLRTVVDEGYDAFHGTGPALQRLLDNVSSLTTTANQHFPQTRQLLADTRTVLDTQQRQTANLTTFSGGLATIAGQLRTSDPDLRTVLATAPGTAGQVHDLLDRSGGGLGVILANLLTTSRVLAPRQDALRQLLVTFPVISAFTPSTSPDGTGHLGIVLDFFYPPSCVRGYESTPERGANDLSEAPVNTRAYCAEPRGSPISVRGAQNAPFAGRAPAPATAPGGPAPAPQLPGLLGTGSGARTAPGTFDVLLGGAG